MSHSALWYPYAQMKTLEIQRKVVRAEGVMLEFENGEKLIDAISSWWCVIHGYNHPEINEAAISQIHQFAHVMLGGLSHEPAEKLAAKLVEITPEPLKHVFFADSGSVGMEVAMKMAIQYWSNQGKAEKKRFISLYRAYHGDTTGVMSISDPEESMHSLFHGSLLPQLFVPPPEGRKDLSCVEPALEALENTLKDYSAEVAAMVVEPLMQGAGNFNLYPERYLQEASQMCRDYGVLLIFDEVATGFGRTGTMFAADRAQVCPDIMTLSKALTAGYTGMSATLATEQVYNAFLGDSYEKAFMHGPTFMGNPTACAIALKSIEIFERENHLEKIAAIEAQLQEELGDLRAPGIVDVRVLGALGVVETRNRTDWEGIQEFAAERGVWLRPFDRVVYTMPPYIISSEQLSQITSVIREWFQP